MRFSSAEELARNDTAFSDISVRANVGRTNPQTRRNRTKDVFILTRINILLYLEWLVFLPLLVQRIHSQATEQLGIEVSRFLG